MPINDPKPDAGEADPEVEPASEAPPEPPNREIEVKFAVEPGDLSGVHKELPQQPGKIEDYTVHFFDRQPLALFGKGLIIRLRQRPAKGDDAAFKVRGTHAFAALAFA